MLGIFEFVLLGCTALALTLSTITLYRLVLHPSAKFPGPALWAITRLPYAYYLYRGTLHQKIHELHNRHGPVVRVAPSEISFINAEAWNDIYGKATNKSSLAKDDLQFLRAKGQEHDLLFEPDDDEHARMRRNFSHAFSEKSLRDQEPIFMANIQKMIFRLHEVCDKPVDISAWLNYVTFDVMGFLTFGDNFGCLDHGALHPWVANLFTWVSAACLLGMTQRFWPLSYIILMMMPKSMKDSERWHRAKTKEKLDKRLANKHPARPDFISTLQKFINLPHGLSYDEIFNTCSIFMVGGSETTSTVLCGVLHGLLNTPPTYTKLVSEIRSTYKSASEITPASLSKLEYITMCIHEGLRMLHPNPGNLRRVTPAGGSKIAGWDVPGNTLVAVDNYSAYHSSFNFQDPETFAPERWAASPPDEYKGDNLKALQGFSVGPRNCVGKNLAMLEMKLILAHLVFAFDIKVKSESANYVNELKAYGFYERGPFWVEMTPVEAVA